ncbi:hypothetical protein RO3G_06240 [Rhizopus delemar RA 99-880]|uniref:Uncharacterized protein n=1 Tax=Rhizopus delemar (strain RA 99-880 / ATCC MYA-4621 / FGSC 9543 / NRRL 43880) TaxID=246409 RepID=I1BZA5_RHIO9|nr:hypothetical protein RO3G_06240 [Rhizopus delemar RA 99-880]|eukprot:EIE81535.1 hypothetical protein RO3G_06240 [Rhizopus delemar RA 99-880]
MTHIEVLKNKKVMQLINRGSSPKHVIQSIVFYPQKKLAETWNSIEWLIRNYKSKNGIPEFLMEGAYKVQHRPIAEG